MKLRDKDYIETVEGLFFCVVGYLHPPDKYTAYLKYVPSKGGLWGRGSARYRRVLKRYHALQVREAMWLLEEKYPHYVHYCPVRNIRISMVPVTRIKRAFRPRERLREIAKAEERDPLEEEVLELAILIRDAAGIGLDKLGVTGSVLIGIHRPEFSDIDLVVYSREAALKVIEALREPPPPIKEPPEEKKSEWVSNLTKFFGLTKRQAEEVARRRWNYKVFRGRYFSVHPVREDHEIAEKYGEKTYQPLGMVEGTCTVVDASESMFLPAVYRVSDVELKGGKHLDIREIVSYEGIFSSILREGEKVYFKGKLEKVRTESETYYIVTIGTFEVPDNHVAPIV